LPKIKSRYKWVKSKHHKSVKSQKHILVGEILGLQNILQKKNISQSDVAQTYWISQNLKRNDSYTHFSQ
jgi:hypothetical protein